MQAELVQGMFCFEYLVLEERWHHGMATDRLLTNNVNGRRPIERHSLLTQAGCSDHACLGRHEEDRLSK